MNKKEELRKFEHRAKRAVNRATENKIEALLSVVAAHPGGEQALAHLRDVQIDKFVRQLKTKGWPEDRPMMQRLF